MVFIERRLEGVSLDEEHVASFAGLKRLHKSINHFLGGGQLIVNLELTNAAKISQLSFLKILFWISPCPNDSYLGSKHQLGSIRVAPIPL